MGQEDVLKFLEKNKGRDYTAQEIADKLKQMKVITTLTKLYKQGFIKRNLNPKYNFRRCVYWIPK